MIGICPNCTNKLTSDSALITKSSSIFKGNNVYALCKNCNQVLLYNRDRDMIFDLDDFKDDENVIEEINLLLSAIDNHYEVSCPAVEECTNNCNTCDCCNDCSGCTDRDGDPYQNYFSRKKKVDEPIKEEPVNLINSTLNYGFLAVNKEDASKKQLILEEDLGSIKVDEWIFFELTPVTIKAITTYEIERH